MFMSLIRDGAATLDGVLAIAAWEPRTMTCDAHPAAGTASVATSLPEGLAFVLSKTAPVGAGVLSCHACDVPARAVLRLDEVCFPVGAIAHRHTHSGAGIRHLVAGQLRIEAPGNSEVMNVGQSWYEPQNTPVRAVALQPVGVTRFVRCMVVPLAFEGQSTFSLVDPADADLPRLQVTHRHFDHRL
jgi:quercetin dioxygenase-like cupin family protein